VIEVSAFAALLGDDRDAIRGLCRRFFNASQPVHEALSQAVARAGDPETVRLEAHRLKGAAAMVRARDLRAACQAVEDAAARADWDALGALMSGLTGEWQRVAAFIDAF
jgi:HPt (histidine-containing phosphotransfer) domain-containing protein